METKIFEDFEIVEGKVKVVLSAPHAFIHIRDGEVRPSETNTDTLVRDICEKEKCWGIYKTYSSDNDANHDEVSLYKKELIKDVKRSKIKFLIDLHGMGSDKESDICLGTGFFKNLDGDEKLISEIADIFKKHGFKNVTIDDPFDASFPWTVSSHVHNETGIKTLQIEINGKYRLPDSPDLNIKGLEEALSDIIEMIKKIK